MSEQNQETTVDVKQEREALKARCQLLGIQTQGNQSNETLRALIRTKQEDMDAAARHTNLVAFDEAVATSEGRTPSLREYLKSEALKLVRVRISCMNPQLAKSGSVIITTGNEYIGTVRKVVFFGEKTENGYHIPQIILNVLQQRKFQQIVEERGPQGHMVPRARWMKEFNIEILPPLTQKELNALKDRQLATNAID